MVRYLTMIMQPNLGCFTKINLKMTNLRIQNNTSVRNTHSSGKTTHIFRVKPPYFFGLDPNSNFFPLYASLFPPRTREYYE